MKEDWEIKRLGEVCENLDNKRIPITQNKRTKGKIPYYGASGIVDYVSEYIFNEELLCVSEDGANLLARTYPIAFSISGKTWVNNHAHVLRFNNSSTQKFIEIYLNSIPLDEYVSGMAQPKLNQAMLNKIPIPLPPLPEQQRIVSILDECFAAIDKAKANAEQNLKNTKELFESYLKEVFEEKREGWEEKKLGEIYHISSSKRIMEKDWTTSGVPFYGGKEIVKLSKFGSVVSNSYISEDKYNEYASKYDMPQQGDILITARGTIGIGYIVQKGDKFYYKDGNIISIRAKIPTNPRFILYALKSNAIYEQLKKLTGATVTHLPIEKAKELVFMIPNSSTQNFVVEKIKIMEAETQRLEAVYQKKIEELGELKKSILQKAFAGELKTEKVLAV
jgi:type I restriction enzyme S subunit